MKIQDFLADVKGSRIVALRTKTEVKLLVNSKDKTSKSKEEFPQGVSKIAVRNGFIGTNYENVVNNKIVREADENAEVPYFDAQALWGGKGESVDRFLARHVGTGELYLKFLPKMQDGLNVTRSIYIDNSTGQEVDKEKVEKYISSSKPSASGVNWQVIKLANVIGVGEINFE